MIGLIIILGGGLAEVLRATGVAGQTVRSVMRFAGGKGRTAAAFAMMISCLLLVAALGTLAGALAVAVPLLLPHCREDGVHPKPRPRRRSSSAAAQVWLWHRSLDPTWPS